MATFRSVALLLVYLNFTFYTNKDHKVQDENRVTKFELYNYGRDQKCTNKFHILVQMF